MNTLVLSAPGRDATGAAIFRRLEQQNPDSRPPILYAVPGGDPIGDFWRMLRFAAEVTPGADLLALEDDVVTARNFIAYAEAWQAPYLTSFFTVSTYLPRQTPTFAVSFGYNQALKIPARLVRWLAALEPVRRPGWLQDNALCAALFHLGELVIYHRPSLVQHVGAVSLCRPGAALPVAPDFPGERFDCLSLLDLNAVQCRTTPVPFSPPVPTQRTTTHEVQMSEIKGQTVKDTEGALRPQRDSNPLPGSPNSPVSGRFSPPLNAPTVSSTNPLPPPAPQPTVPPAGTWPTSAVMLRGAFHLEEQAASLYRQGAHGQANELYLIAGELRARGHVLQGEGADATRHCADLHRMGCPCAALARIGEVRS